MKVTLDKFEATFDIVSDTRLYKRRWPDDFYKQHWQWRPLNDLLLYCKCVEGHLNLKSQNNIPTHITCRFYIHYATHNNIFEKTKMEKNKPFNCSSPLKRRLTEKNCCLLLNFHQWKRQHWYGACCPESCGRYVLLRLNVPRVHVFFRKKEYLWATLDLQSCIKLA